MKKQALIVAFFLVFFVPFIGRSQEKLSIDKVYSVNLRNSGEILEGEIIKGYYLFYQSDKIDRKTNEYTLQILDQNLGKVKDIKFQDTKNLFLLESSYNGEALGFLYWDTELKQLDFRVYDMTGKKKMNYTKELDRRTEQLIAQQRQTSGAEEGENQNIFDVSKKGFVSINPLKDGKVFSYEVNYYSSLSKKSWSYIPTEEGKYANAQFLGANDSLILLEVIKKEKLMSGKLTSFVLGLNVHNGKKAFEISTETGTNKFLPINLSKQAGKSEFVLIGPYFDGDDKIMQDQSKGLAIWVIDSKGKVINEKYKSWEGDISKFLKLDKKGRLENIGYVYFHEILQTEDGKFFAIGEGYRKQASAGGIALKVLSTAAGGGGGVSATKLNITEMVLLQFSSSFELENATIYDKNNNNMSLPGGDFMSPHTMALFVKAYGGFDYSFTMPSKNNTSFYTGYTDYERSKDFNGLTFHSISYTDGQISTDKINLTTKSSRMSIHPAKPGYLMILEYFRKEKRLDLRLEKIN